jgi:hypothetical protein
MRTLARDLVWGLARRFGAERNLWQWLLVVNGGRQKRVRFTALMAKHLVVRRTYNDRWVAWEGLERLSLHDLRELAADVGGTEWSGKYLGWDVCPACVHRPQTGHSTHCGLARIKRELEARLVMASAKQERVAS